MRTAMIATTSAQWLAPIRASQANDKFDAICSSAPTHRHVTML